MGSSKSIEELEAADQKFEAYLATKRKEIEERQTSTRKKMDEAVEKFYRDGGWSDRKPLLTASYVDVQNISEWSLTNVNNILTAISGAIFGSNNPPPGTDIDSDVSNNDVIMKIPSLQMLVLSKAFSAIQGIMEVFTTKSSTNITMQEKIEIVSPGLTVFIYVNSNSFQQKSFFNNDLITQYFYLIDAYTSGQQLGDYSTFQDLSLFEKEKESLRGIASRIIGTMDTVTELPQLQQLSLQLDGIYERLDTVTERINDLTEEEKKTMLGIADQIRMRKSLTLKN